MILLLYECKTTDKRGQYNWIVEKYWDWYVSSRGENITLDQFHKYYHKIQLLFYLQCFNCPHNLMDDAYHLKGICVNSLLVGF